MSSTPLVKSLFPERFETLEHPRETIRESIHARLSQPVNILLSQMRSAIGRPLARRFTRERDRNPL